MRTLSIILFVIGFSHISSAQITRHEIGVNFAKASYYETAVWDENESFLQIVSPITYKYFINESSALRASLHYNTNEHSSVRSHSYSREDASCFSASVGYQKFFGLKKLRPNVYTDLTFISEDYFLEHRNLSPASYIDYTSSGFAISGGVGLRYELSSSWALAYETDIGLYSRKMNGYELDGTSRTTWSNAIITNLEFNPVSNFSVNFRW
jgi:hypothetical protein